MTTRQNLTVNLDAGTVVELRYLKFFLNMRKYL